MAMLISRCLILIVGLGCFVPCGRAADYTWTNTTANTSGFWTNDILWGTPGNYPGSTATDNAYLTNSIAGAYTNILNFTLPNTISTLVVSNSSNGQSWLVLTNATLNNDTLVVGSGGRLRVDNGGLLNNTTSFTLTGTNGLVTLNSGGSVRALGGLILSPNADTTNTLTVNAGGSLFVTNSAGTSALVVGGGGRGTLTLNNGSITADQLYVTNGTIAFRGGTLTTLNGATYSGMTLGTGTWVMAGGIHTNLLVSTFTIGSAAETGAVLVTGSSTVLANPSGQLTLTTGSSLTVSNGAQASIGVIASTSYTLIKVSSNAVLRSVGGNALSVWGGADTGNQILVENGSQWLHSSSGISFGGISNTLLFAGTNSFVRLSMGSGRTVAFGNGSGSQGIVQPASGNGAYDSFIVSNGARLVTLVVSGTHATFYGASNSFVVTGSGSLYSNLFHTGGYGYNWKYAYSNTMTVADGGEVFVNGYMRLDSSNTNNLLLVRDANSLVRLETDLRLDGFNNTILISNGGILETSGLSNGVADAGNVITNFGGVYQFTTATPTITTNGAVGGSIFLSDGVIAFRNVSSGLHLTNNTDTTRLGRLTYSGDNTLRLNNSTATNSVAGGYTFQTGGAFNNYNRLELVGATNALTGTGVTIGSGGSFLASNTVATFGGVFTNLSANARLVESVVNFTNGLHVVGTLSLVNSYVKGGGAKTVAGRLEGNGIVVGDATVSGVIAPGFSPGSITFSNNFTLTGTAEMELFSGGNLGASDKINVLGALAGGGLVQVTTNGTFVIAVGDKWDLFDWSSGTPALTFDGSAVALGAGLSWDVSQLNVDGTIGVILIPEPSAMLLVLAGFGLWLVVGQWRLRRGW
ncbi:MAG: hypothetical protein PCFJNLEI_02095 [Verrucomicrobiae bacterium]|nr:hypothetical protein [Verrucomicrobiae bacterium]